jgi:phosphatidylglycerophosphate synthase
MIKKPQKIAWIAAYRKRQDAITDAIPWPNIHPNIISGLSIVFAIVFVIAFDPNDSMRLWLALAFLVIGNMLDAVDGSIARRYHYDLNKGWIVDVTVDRVAEFIIFLLFPIPWLVIWAVNLVVSIIAYQKGKHIMLALRIPFLIYFVIVYFLM